VGGGYKERVEEGEYGGYIIYSCMPNEGDGGIKENDERGE
jgi:hypothetical protein